MSKYKEKTTTHHTLDIIPGVSIEEACAIAFHKVLTKERDRSVSFDFNSIRIEMRPKTDAEMGRS